MAFIDNDGNNLTDVFITDSEIVDRFVGSSILSWGYNNYGQLGDNTITNKSSPIQVGSLTNWKQVACGNYHTIAIKV